MKWSFLALIFGLLLAGFASADQYGYLDKNDQKYFKNDSMDGNNQRERIDFNVKEINKLHGDVAALKAQVQELKTEIEALKKSK